MSFCFGLKHNVTDHQSRYLGVPWCTVVTRIALSARCPILSHNIPDNLDKYMEMVLSCTVLRNDNSLWHGYGLVMLYTYCSCTQVRIDSSLLLLCAQKSLVQSTPLVLDARTWRAPEAQSQWGWRRPRRRRSKPWKRWLVALPYQQIVDRETAMQSSLRHWETSRPLPEGRALSSLSPGRLPAQETRKFHCPLNLFILRTKSNPMNPYYQRKQHRGECQGLQSVRVLYARLGKVDPAWIWIRYSICTCGSEQIVKINSKCKCVLKKVKI